MSRFQMTIFIGDCRSRPVRTLCGSPAFVGMWAPEWYRGRPRCLGRLVRLMRVLVSHVASVAM